ncbi:aldo/keto reductase [Inquilinus limosus]|uniref:aldo/keto reductase n=1 Tax=Inquilinus limosus TaxID=171674 RepID=UPI000419778F|nr:aldo/keto reductase [Inquilinus limosus]
MFDPVERRPIGRTSLRVSRLGIGGGSLFSSIGDAAVAALVDHCWERGLRHFDTAALYAGGVSEERFGTALADRPRDEHVLSTKAGRTTEDGENRFDYTRDGFLRSIDRSLTRLKRDRLDIVFIHDVTPDLLGDAYDARFAEAMDGAYPALAELRSQGVVGAVGVGVGSWQVCRRFAEAGDFDCMMLAGGYTLLKQDSVPFLDQCLARGISVLLAAPFNTGILATGAVEGARYQYRPAPPEILERTRRIEAVCRRHDVPLPAAALQFPLRHPAVASVVVGHQSAEEVDRNMALLRREIPDAFWAELAAEGVAAVQPTP